ncbi:hypothetical protein PFISCL1PPCAC_7710, partial [Pristionchus fissidentatus]
FVDRFEGAVNMHASWARGALVQEGGRYEELVKEYQEKKLPNFEWLTEAFRRQIDLQLMNFRAAGRSSMDGLKELLIQSLMETSLYSDEAVEEFTDRALTYIQDEFISFRDDAENTYHEAFGKSEWAVVRAINNLEKMKRANRQRTKKDSIVSAANSLSDASMVSAGDTDSIDIKTFRELVNSANEEVDALVKSHNDHFDEMLKTETRFTKKSIDANIRNAMPEFDNVLKCALRGIRQSMANTKQTLQRMVEIRIDNLERQVADRREEFPLSTTIQSLQEKIQTAIERMEKQCKKWEMTMNSYRTKERDEIISQHHFHDSSNIGDFVLINGNDFETLYDGTIVMKREKTEVDLSHLELTPVDGDKFSTCEVRKTFLLRKIDEDESENFAALHYKQANLLKYFGICTHGENRFAMFEHFPETLLTLLELNPNGLSKEDFIQFLNWITQAIEFMHTQRRFHGDLRPENVFIDRDADGDIFGIKVADFGISSDRQIQDSIVQIPVKSAYSAPEVNGNEVVTSWNILQKSDIWSVGMLMWTALTGIVRKESDSPPPLFRSGLSALRELLESCWRQNVEDRPSINQIGQQIRSGVIYDIAFNFEEDEQWKAERLLWRNTAGK